MPDAETRRWWLRVSIVCPAAPGRPNREEKPVIVRSFFTEVDAEKAGVAFAKQWIDESESTLQ